MFENNFMLEGKTACQLYDKYAKAAPIYDYHCHLDAKEIYEDEVFTDISSLWLDHDHYKWRAMRYAGVPEGFITGNEDSKARFKAWAQTCGRLIGSPLYHWANMELHEYFGVEKILTADNAEHIYELCNDKIKREQLSPVKMIQKSRVKLICTTDDPADALEYHRLLKTKEELDFQVLPTFRPDKALNIQKEDFTEYISKLSAACGFDIKDYQELLQALSGRIRYFKAAGCKITDHSLESLDYYPATLEEVEQIFKNRLSGRLLTKEDEEKYRLYTLLQLAKEYKKENLVMQLHIGAYRNVNEASLQKLGVDAGFDIMNDFRILEPLAKLLNAMDRQDNLPKTILYTLNSKDNLVLSSLPHCFTEAGIPGKLQFGPAWWFNDHKGGIKNHLSCISEQGMLADYVGMLTDSRSFLSYVRHDYFRRILCSFIGELVDNGEFDKNEDLLKSIIEGICYKNIIKYLDMES